MWVRILTKQGLVSFSAINKIFSSQLCRIILVERNKYLTTLLNQCLLDAKGIDDLSDWNRFLEVPRVIGLDHRRRDRQLRELMVTFKK